MSYPGFKNRTDVSIHCSQEVQITHTSIHHSKTDIMFRLQQYNGVLLSYKMTFGSEKDYSSRFILSVSVASIAWKVWWRRR
jgi:hypothetical protein